MIKVPATPQGIPAIHQLIAEGISVNVTLLFAQDAYERVADAYIHGLERYAASGGDLKRVASVASFFISRIDTAVDTLIAARLLADTNANEIGVLGGLIGKIAIANAKLTYQRHKELFSGPRWQSWLARCSNAGLLWASTGRKTRLPDVIYIEELIGPIRSIRSLRDLRRVSRSRPAAGKSRRGSEPPLTRWPRWRRRNTHQQRHRQAAGGRRPTSGRIRGNC
jgi:transaldolase/glucose-6-phosphate isomerase